MNVLMRALVQCCGIDPEAPMTKTEAKSYATAAAELKRVGATAVDIRERCALYHQRMPPDSTMTPFAVVKHWGRLDPRIEPPQGQRLPKAMTAIARAAERT